MTKKTEPSPHTPLTQEEWDNMGPVMHGLDKLPEAAQKAFRKRGRPFSDNPKKLVSLRVDADVLDAFKNTGTGWQTRINQVLKEWTEAHC